MFMRKGQLVEDDCTRVATQCVNFRLRKFTRLVAALYDDALRGAHLRGTQFNLLVGLGVLGSPTLSRLSQTLGMDRTSLTRALAPLERDGLVRSQQGRDARERVLTLTTAGRRRLAAAIPLWERAQTQLAAIVGPTLTQQLAADLESATGWLLHTR